MKTLYVSQYLNTIKLRDSFLLVNGVNGCIDEVSNELGDFLKKNKIIEDDNFISTSEIDYLKKRAHITDLIPEKEKEVFKSIVSKIDSKALESSKKHGSLMLLLGYDCNLNCNYCYQKPVKKLKGSHYMTGNYIDELYLKYFPILYKDSGIEGMSITLYGGEPFLKKNTSAIDRVLHYAAKYSQNIGAISNCTNLNFAKDMFGPLPGQVNFIQVSFDSDKEYHDKSRIASENHHTFETILSNVHKLLDRKVKLKIRINITGESINGLKPLIERLKNEDILDHPYSFVYMYPIHNYFDQMEDSSGLLDHLQLSDIIESSKDYSSINHPISRKADDFIHLLKVQKGVALHKTRFCMQNYPNLYLIDPLGDIYGCYEEAGTTELKIGTLREGNVTFTPLKDDYLSQSILKFSDCLECPIALFCGGGCGASVRHNKAQFCAESKDLLYRALKHNYENENKRYRADNDFTSLYPYL